MALAYRLAERLAPVTGSSSPRPPISVVASCAPRSRIDGCARCGARRLLGSEPPGWPILRVPPGATPPAAVVATRNLLDSSVDQAAVLGFVQSLADHLLRGRDDEPGDLVARSLQGALALDLDVAACAVHDPLVFKVGFLPQVGAQLFPRAIRAFDHGVGGLARPAPLAVGPLQPRPRPSSSLLPFLALGGDLAPPCPPGVA